MAIHGWKAALKLGVALCAAAFVSCASEKTQDEEKGGDHLPDLKTYVVSSLPKGSTETGLRPTSTESDYLRRYVRLAEHIKVCLDADTFSEDTLVAFKAFVKRKGRAFSEYGLEAITNRAFEDVSILAKSTRKFSSRLDLDIVFNTKSTCDVVFTKVADKQFPFSSEEFSEDSHALLYEYQLKVENSEASNKVPVIYLSEALSNEALLLGMQYELGSYLGLAQSHLEGSYLNSKTASMSPAPTWYYTTDVRALQFDTLVFSNYAALYFKILKPSDMETYHHFEDAFDPTSPVSDNDLAFVSAASPIRFHEKIGHAHLNGVRAVTASIRTCLEDNQNVPKDKIQTYLSLLSHKREVSVLARAHDKNNLIPSRVVEVESDCSLLIAFRNAQQFPFNQKSLNGLYAKEGTVQNKFGTVLSIPVIYLNVSNLALEETPENEDKYIGLVLAHEFAHFLGFKHSPDSDSVLAPAGYHSSLGIGDAAMIESFVKEWNAMTR